MFIQTEATSDPAVLKFLPGRDVLPGRTLSICDPSEATHSPLAAKLFEVPGVIALSFGSDYITVTKNNGEWQHLRPAVLGAIMEHFMAGAPVVIERPTNEAATAGAGTLTGQIRDALHRVIDPELGYNIVDLGLIYDVRVDANGIASVTMTTTTPGCPATSYLTEGARQCASSVEGVETAEVILTHEPRWTPELMSDKAKAHLGIR